MSLGPGLVHASILDGKGGCRDAKAADIAGWSPEQGCLWIHLDRGSEDAREWLRHDSGLEANAADAMLAIETRPRSISFRNGLLVILRGVNLNAGADPEDMVALRMWVEKDRVITVRARRLMAVQAMRDSLDEGRGPADAGGLLAGIANGLVDRMGPVIDEMGDVVDGLEDELLVSESRDIRMRLREMRREAIGLRRHLAPQRDALARLQQEDQPWLDASHRMRLRETADRVLRIVEELDELRERAAIIQDELMNRLSEQMNRTMYVLTVVASILLPLSFVTGLLGINVGGIPLAENSLGFIIVVAILVVVGALQIYIFRRLKWM